MFTYNEVDVGDENRLQQKKHCKSDQPDLGLHPILHYKKLLK